MIEQKALSGTKNTTFDCPKGKKVCFPKHAVTVQLDTGRNSLLPVNSVFIVAEIEKRPNKLPHPFSEEYFPDSTVQTFFAKFSKGASTISFVKSLTGSETLGDFFPWYLLLLSAGFHPCPTARKRRVQRGGLRERSDGGCVLAGDTLPTNHFQMSHLQSMLSDCEMQRNLSAVELSYVPAPSQLQLMNHQDARGFCGVSRALDISPSSALQTLSDLKMRSNYKAVPALSWSSGPMISGGPVQPHVPCNSSRCFISACWPEYANKHISER